MSNSNKILADFQEANFAVEAFTIPSLPGYTEKIGTFEEVKTQHRQYLDSLEEHRVKVQARINQLSAAENGLFLSPQELSCYEASKKYIALIDSRRAKLEEKPNVHNGQPKLLNTHYVNPQVAQGHVEWLLGEISQMWASYFEVPTSDSYIEWHYGFYNAKVNGLGLFLTNVRAVTPTVDVINEVKEIHKKMAKELERHEHTQAQSNKNKPIIASNQLCREEPPLNEEAD